MGGEGVMDATTMEQLRATLEARCILRGDFTLASGKQSNYYYNGKAGMLAGPVKVDLARALWELAEGIEFDTLGGPAVGAVPLVEQMSVVSALEQNRTVDTFYVRNEKKEHGTQSALYQAQGEDGSEVLLPGSRALVVEDALTTGGSIRVALEAVEAAGAVVAGVLLVADRQDPDADWLRTKYDYRCLFQVDNDGGLLIAERAGQPA
jgi:orotate phosphoribosyltransferase